MKDILPLLQALIIFGQTMEDKIGKKLNEEDRLVNRIRDLRSPDVHSIASKIRVADIGKLRQTVKYYPLRFLGDGVDAYRYGFDNAAVFYAGIAVELALLSLLGDTIKTAQRKNLKLKVDFSWLINHSDKLLDEEGKKVCHDIRIMRNCYIHYQNIVAHIAYLQQIEWPCVVEQTKEGIGDNPDAVRFVNLVDQMLQHKYDANGMLPIRFEHLENKEVMPFIEDRYEKYKVWLPVAWSERKTRMTTKEFNHIYNIEAFDALQCLIWSYDTIIKLRLI